MSAFVKTIDTTRLITFASFNVWRDYVKKPEDEASQYVDFVSANMYGNHLKILQQHPRGSIPTNLFTSVSLAYALTPNKTEADRIAYFKKALEDIRRCEYVTGASVWSFNDYLSRYPGTDADGYRSWGLVTPARELRGTYHTLQEEFAPVTMEMVEWKNGKLTITVQARADFLLTPCAITS